MLLSSGRVLADRTGYIVERDRRPWRPALCYVFFRLAAAQQVELEHVEWRTRVGHLVGVRATIGRDELAYPELKHTVVFRQFPLEHHLAQSLQPFIVPVEE